jgi:hypothetical protein
LGAQRLLESFLLSVAVGVTPVHQLRRIDADFMNDYMLPNLEEDEAIGNLADALAAPAAPEGDAPPAGVRELAGDPDPDGDDTPAQVDVRNMINLVTRRDKRVEVPGIGVKAQRLSDMLADPDLVTMALPDDKCLRRVDRPRGSRRALRAPARRRRWLTQPRGRSRAACRARTSHAPRCTPQPSSTPAARRPRTHASPTGTTPPAAASRRQIYAAANGSFVDCGLLIEQQGSLMPTHNEETPRLRGV